MLNLREMRSNVLKIIDSLRESILRQVNSKKEDTNIDYERNQLVWQISQLFLITELIEKHNTDTISTEDWLEELKNLDNLSIYLKYN